MTEMRKDKRAPASLKVKYKSASVDDFIAHFGGDVSRNGVFIKTKKPLDAGAHLRFELQLQDGSAVLQGVGRVAWRRLEAAAQAELPAGMGIKFLKLNESSREVVERIAERPGGANSRYEQTSAAELAPPVSMSPPAAESGGQIAAGNGRRVNTGSGPLTVPPPPAVSSMPPALAAVPPSRGASPMRDAAPLRNAAPARDASPVHDTTALRSAAPVRGQLQKPPITRTATGSFFSDPAPNDPAPNASGAPGLRSRAGQGSREPVQRAGRDPSSAELARELFGDLGDRGRREKSTLPPAPDASPEMFAEASPTAHHAVTTPAPAAFAPNPPVPALELPRGAAGRHSSRPSVADKVPSMEQLVQESERPVARGESASQRSLRPVAALGPASARSSGRQPAVRPRSSGAPALGAGAAAGMAEAPLTLAMAVPSVRAAASESGGRSRLLLFAALASTLSLGGLAVYVGLQGNASATGAIFGLGARRPPSEPAAAAERQYPPPPKVLEESAPAAGQPPSAAAPAAELAITIDSKPRGAEVWLAGSARGTTPLSLQLPAGVPVVLRVQRPGYAALERSFTPRPGEQAQAFELAPLPYQLVVHSEPVGATISAGGRSVIAPAALELGRIEAPISVSIDKDGYQRSLRSLRPEEFQERDGAMRAELSLSLSPLPAAQRKRAAPAAPRSPQPSDATTTAQEQTTPVMQVRPSGDAPAEEAAPSAPSEPAPAPVESAPPPATPAPTPAPEAAPAPAPPAAESPPNDDQPH